MSTPPITPSQAGSVTPTTLPPLDLASGDVPQGLDVSSEGLAPLVSFYDTSVAFAAKDDFQLRKTYYLFAMMNRPWLVKFGTEALRLSLKLRLPVKWLVKQTVFSQFVGGESVEDCEMTVRELGRYRIGSILDYSVEGASEESGFDRTAEEIVGTVRRAGLSLDVPFAVFKVTGVAPTPLLEKRQSGAELTQAERAAWERVVGRVDRICAEAAERNVRVFVDAEESWLQGSIDELAYAMMRKHNQDRPVVWNTYQLYAKAALPALKAAVEEAERSGYYLGAKLVRGAYIEKERARARERGYEDPMQPDKTATDRDYDAALSFCLDRLETVAFCAVTHNEYSCSYLANLMSGRGMAPDDPRVWFAQLYGMSDHISYNLAQAGYNVAKYVPYGPVASVMPYLFRRAEENTSIAGQSSREFQLVSKEFQRRKAEKKLRRRAF